ncbi:MAG: hypothetical protein OEV92_07755 [Nitrospinota bacterium]|nr:hypothetical protein [Nitrospinota bacterium]
MVILKKVTAAFCALAIMLPAATVMAHGKALTLGKVEDAALALGAGARLEPMKTETATGQISWLTAMGAGGETLGFVGVARENTDHGYLAQATALDMEGKIVTVIVLRVMEDEKRLVGALVRNDGWWRGESGARPEGAALALLRSVGKVAAAFPAIKPR